MVKSELLAELSRKFPDLPKKDIELAVNCMLNQLGEAMANGEHIEIRGFGNFDTRNHKPRLARNPKTGVSISLDAKARLHFKPGKELRDRVNATRTKYKIVD